MLNPYLGEGGAATPEAAAFAYLVLLVLALPVCIWVAWSDLARMKIPNVAVGALLAVFAVAGFLLIPFDFWIWRWLNLIVVLAIGFALFAFAGWGAGDAKFAAAAAPFVGQSMADIQMALLILAVFMLGALGFHRGLRAIPAVRRATLGWQSWTSAKFPLGLALSGALVAYLALKAGA